MTDVLAPQFKVSGVPTDQRICRAGNGVQRFGCHGGARRLENKRLLGQDSRSGGKEDEEEEEKLGVRRNKRNVIRSRVKSQAILDCL